MYVFIYYLSSTYLTIWLSNLSVCMSVYVSAYLAICLSVYPFVYVSIYYQSIPDYLSIWLADYFLSLSMLFFFVSLSISPNIHISLCLCLSLSLPSICLSVWPPLCLSLSLCLYIFLYSFIYLSNLPVYLAIYVSSFLSSNLKRNDYAIMRGFLHKWKLTCPKRSNSASLLQRLTSGSNYIVGYFFWHPSFRCDFNQVSHISAPVSLVKS